MALDCCKNGNLLKWTMEWSVMDEEMCHPEGRSVTDVFLIVLWTTMEVYSADEHANPGSRLAERSGE